MAQHARPYPYAESTRNQQLTALHDEGPQFTDELPNGARFTPQARRYVGSISPPWGSGKSVWYLWGDERAAMQRFVNEYADQIRESMDKKNSILSSRMDDSMWRMLCEEYYWSVATDEERKEIAAKQRKTRKQSVQDDIDAETTDE